MGNVEEVSYSEPTNIRRGILLACVNLGLDFTLPCFKILLILGYLRLYINAILLGHEYPAVKLSGN
jgi:hypothetical protein